MSYFNFHSRKHHHLLFLLSTWIKLWEITTTNLTENLQPWKISDILAPILSEGKKRSLLQNEKSLRPFLFQLPNFYCFFPHVNDQAQKVHFVKSFFQVSTHCDCRLYDMTQPFIVVRGLIQNLTAGKNNFKLAIITNGAWKCATEMEQFWVDSQMIEA